MQLNVTQFTNLLRRFPTSAYPVLFVHSHMLMNCYTVDIDSDVGSHSIVYVPEDYPDFWDGPFLIRPADILTKIREGQKKLKEYRDKYNLPSKAQEVILEYEKSDTGITLTYNFIVNKIEKVAVTEYSFKMFKSKKNQVVEKTKEKQMVTDELIRYTETDFIPYVDETNLTVENIIKTYDQMVDRMVGEPVTLDLLSTGLYDIVCSNTAFYYHPVEVNGNQIHIPLIKSLFRRVNDPDELKISISETSLTGVYVYVIYILNKGIAEESISYFQSFTFKHEE